MKVTVKDLKKKGATRTIIDFFKKHSRFKSKFGKTLDIFYAHSLLEFFCIDWFITNFRYKKIHSIKLRYKSVKCKIIYTYTGTDLQKYYCAKNGVWMLWMYSKNGNLLYYVDSTGKERKYTKYSE